MGMPHLGKPPFLSFLWGHRGGGHRLGLGWLSAWEKRPGPGPMRGLNVVLRAWSKLVQAGQHPCCSALGNAARQGWPAGD